MVILSNKALDHLESPQRVLVLCILTHPQAP
jgi:hypothetical protein